METVAKGQAKRKRSKRGYGRLFKKVGRKQYAPEAPVKGEYYLTYSVKGERFTTALRDAEDKPIEDRQQAEAERRRIMAPYQTGDEVETLRAIKAKLDDAEQEHAGVVEQQDPPLAIGDAWNAFEKSLRRPDSGPGTLSNYASHWKQFVHWLGEHHGDVEHVRDISVDIAAEYAGYLQRDRQVSPNTFNKHVRLLSLVFQVLRDPARWEVNPWTRDNISRKTQNPQSRRELTVAELWQVCTEAKGELQTLLAIGIYTGMRRGDCATLRWGEVDLVRRQITRIPLKTGRRHPVPVVISIHLTLAGMLAAVPHTERGEYVLPETAALYLRDARELTRRIQAHFERCGIVTKAERKGNGIRAVSEVGFHSLRHTFVSLCRAGDVPLAVVEKLVGHSNPAMTRHYTHVSAEAAESAMKCLPDVIGGAAAVVAVQESAPLDQQVRQLAESMDASNWKTVRDALLKLVPPDDNPS